MGNRKSIALWTLLGVAALSAVAQAHADHFCVESWDRSVDYFDNDDVLTGFPDGTEVTQCLTVSSSCRHAKLWTPCFPDFVWVPNIYSKNFETWMENSVNLSQRVDGAALHCSVFVCRQVA